MAHISSYRSNFQYFTVGTGPSPTQKVLQSTEIINDFKEWRTSFRHTTSVQIKQSGNTWRECLNTSLNHYATSRSLCISLSLSVRIFACVRVCLSSTSCSFTHTQVGKHKPLVYIHSVDLSRSRMHNTTQPNIQLAVEPRRSIQRWETHNHPQPQPHIQQKYMRMHSLRHLRQENKCK